MVREEARIPLSVVNLACHQPCVRLEAGKTCLCCLCLCKAIREHVAKGFTLLEFYKRQVRDTNLSPAVHDKEIATYSQHALTMDKPVRATVGFERDRFRKFMGIEGSSRAGHKLVSISCVFAVFECHTSALFRISPCRRRPDQVSQFRHPADRVASRRLQEGEMENPHLGRWPVEARPV